MLQGLNPYITASLTTGTLCGISDILSQTIEAKKSKEGFAWRWQRTLRMASCGYVLLGPYMKAWYGMLGRKLPGASLQNFVAKVALNQVNTPVRAATLLCLNLVLVRATCLTAQWHLLLASMALADT